MSSTEGHLSLHTPHKWFQVACRLVEVTRLWCPLASSLRKIAMSGFLYPRIAREFAAGSSLALCLWIQTPLMSCRLLWMAEGCRCPLTSCESGARIEGRYSRTLLGSIPLPDPPHGFCLRRLRRWSLIDQRNHHHLMRNPLRRSPVGQNWDYSLLYL